MEMSEISKVPTPLLMRVRVSVRIQIRDDGDEYEDCRDEDANECEDCKELGMIIRMSARIGMSVGMSMRTGNEDGYV